MDSEDYGMLCSQLTLQSDKRGFFLEFASRVLEVAGSGWLHAFSMVNGDRRKIEYCFSSPEVAEEIDSILSHIEPLNRSKSSWLSQMRRQDAEQASSKGNYQRALLLANQAVVRAPKPGIETEVDEGLSLSLALWIRSDILRSLEQWERSLQDLQLAVKYQLPSNFKCESYWKMCECYYMIGSIDKAKVSLEVWKRFGGRPSFLMESDRKLLEEIELNVKESSTSNQTSIRTPEQKIKSRIPRPVQLLQKINVKNNVGECCDTEGRNSVYTGCSEKLVVRETTGAGREMVAGESLSIGEVVANEQPYSSCLLTDKHGSHCLNCFNRLEVIVCCENCSGIAYCSNHCASLGSLYHRYECKHLDLLIGSGMSVLCFLALRMITQNSVKYFRDLYPRLNDNNFNHPYAHIWRLEGHSDKRDAKSYVHRTLMSIFLVYVLRQTDYFRKNNSVDSGGPLSEDELMIAELLLKHLQVLQYNAHEIYETLSKSKTSLRHTKTNYIGIAVYPSASLFNHDCQPTLARYFEGRSIVLRTVRPLNKGDRVAENYGPVYTMRTKDQRQKSLWARYLFKCVCQACREDWPRLEDMPNDLPLHLRCDSGKCNKTFVYTGRENCIVVKCKSCNTRTNLKEKSLLLSSLQGNFEKGIDEMNQGNVQTAEDILSAYVDDMFRLAAPPHRDLALAQEALRCCWASKSNIIYVT